MINVYRDNGVLFVESKLELRFPVNVNGKKFTKKEKESFEEIDDIYALIERNCRVLIKDDKKFRRFSVGEFADIIRLKKYNLVEGLPAIKKVEKIEPVKEVKTVPAQEPVEEVIEEKPTVVNNIPPKHFENNKKRNKDRQNNNHNDHKKGDDK